MLAKPRKPIRLRCRATPAPWTTVCVAAWRWSTRRARGSGGAIAEVLAAEGVRLVISARTPEALARTAAEIAATHSRCKVVPVPGLMRSNSLRSGVVGLAKTLADELAPGITVNTVRPGPQAVDSKPRG